MAATSALAIGALGVEDVTAGVALSDEAGWNQTADDWRLFLTQGEVFAARDDEARVVATAALLPYAGKAWISLVLVTAARRRQGLATTLMRRCLAAADARGLTSWLDATPAGAAVYAQLGFVDVADGLLRLYRSAVQAVVTTDSAAGALPALVAADRRLMATDRSDLLGALATRPGSRVYAIGDAACIVRDGRNARYIGPLTAPDTGSATELLDTVCGAEAGPLVIDVRAQAMGLVSHLQASGFVVERPYRRMRCGPADGATTPLAIAGPEYG